MRYRRTHPLRKYATVGLLLLLVAMPLAVGGFRADAPAFDPLGFVVVYADGLAALTAVSWLAMPLAGLFGLWLFAGQKREVNRRWLEQSARSRRHFVEGLRSTLVVGGAAAMIVGALTGLHALAVYLRPDLAWPPGLPLVAIPACLVGGLLAHYLGRMGRC